MPMSDEARAVMKWYGEVVALRKTLGDVEETLGRLDPKAWLNLQWDAERGHVAVVQMKMPGEHQTTYHYGRGQTRLEAIRAALAGIDNVIAMNVARDEREAGNDA